MTFEIIPTNPSNHPEGTGGFGRQGNRGFGAQLLSSQRLSHRSEAALGIAGDDRKLIDPSGMKV